MQACLARNNLFFLFLLDHGWRMKKFLLFFSFLLFFTHQQQPLRNCVFSLLFPPSIFLHSVRGEYGGI